ncbi:MAG: ABC transporter permease [Verrucomicrobiota bacterium]|jgi:lipoprotein-releasing system permease protein
MPPFEAFLALRYLRPRRTFVSVITVISVIGVLLGVAVLIVVISVMSGFDQEWRSRILGYNAHLKVYNADLSAMTNFPLLLKEITSQPEVVGAAPFIVGEVVMQTEQSADDSNYAAGILDGIDPNTEGRVTVLATNIVRGEYNVQDKGLLVGSNLADYLHLQVGDRLALYSGRSLKKMADAARKKNTEEAVLPSDFTVRGIFDVGFPAYNRTHVVASLEDAARVLDLPEDGVTGIKVKLRDEFRVDTVAGALQAALKEPLRLVTWREDSPDIFNALAVEKNMMFILLFFIMIVAAFGIVSSQITFVVQKTREIGILKALGASNGQVLWLFLSQSVVVGILGVGLGFGLASLALHYRNEFLHFMRDVTHTQLLPADIYQVYDLPSSIETGDILLICGTAFCACVLAGLFPAWKASRLQPVEALRHE